MADSNQPQPVHPKSAALPVTADDIARALEHHLAVAQRVLVMIEQEHQILHGTGPYPAAEFQHRRETLLPDLHQAHNQLQTASAHWQKIPQSDRDQHPRIKELIRQNQDLILRLVMLDRENEQAMLRRGLTPPGQVKPPSSSRPHFINHIYSRIESMSNSWR